MNSVKKWFDFFFLFEEVKLFDWPFQILFQIAIFAFKIISL